MALGLITWTRFPLRKAGPAAVHLGMQAVAVHFGSFDLGQKDAPLGEREAKVGDLTNAFAFY